MDAIQAIRGTRDILPAEVSVWQRLEATAQNVLSRAGYREIRTPALEATELFVRGIGTATDVVDKEMFSFRTQGDQAVSLRPENTAGVVRAYIQHGLFAEGDVQRLWYCGPMFRYERPQAGRQRQFHQLGLEVLGSANPRSDAEVIALAVDILAALGISELQVSLNSVGSGDDRNVYRQALIDYLTPYKADLDDDSQVRLERNPLRILDSKVPRTREITATAPQLMNYLSPESRSHFETVQAQLTTLGIAYRLNPRLVRGLDYYTHTAFEIESQALGAQSAVCGGGRYDGLVSELGGPATPAVGWAMGMERLALLMPPQSPPAPQVYLISRGDEAEAVALAIAQELRHAGVTTIMDVSGSAFGKQFKRADRCAAPVAVIIGDAEAKTNQVQVKWLAAGHQTTVARSELASILLGAL